MPDARRQRPTGMRTIIFVLAGLALFLSAAKLHGRQLRFERLAHGYTQVRFGAPNAPWVENLWRAERWRFGLAVATFALAGLLLGSLLHAAAGPGRLLAVLLVHVPPAAFVTVGLLSVWRTWPRLPGHAFTGTAGWVAVVLALAAVTAPLSAAWMRRGG
jgi:hypothetical protein